MLYDEGTEQHYPGWLLFSRRVFNTARMGQHSFLQNPTEFSLGVRQWGDTGMLSAPGEGTAMIFNYKVW